MKLEVGKWCRTKKGTIFKIIGGNVDMWEIDIDYSYLSKCENEDYNSYAYNKNNSLFEYLVVKASYNIIDILEIGDIISFYEDIDNYKKQYVIGIPDLITLDNIKDKITNDNIRLVSILTKEEMEQMAYKVEE